MLMNVRIPIRTTVIPTPCVPTPKVPMCVAVSKDIVEMASSAQVLLGIELLDLCNFFSQATVSMELFLFLYLFLCPPCQHANYKL